MRRPDVYPSEQVLKGSRQERAEDGFDVSIDDLPSETRELDALAADISATGRRSCDAPGDVSVESDVISIIDNTVHAVLWETVSNLTNLRSLTLLAPAFPRYAPSVPWCRLAWRSYVSLMCLGAMTFADMTAVELGSSFSLQACTCSAASLIEHMPVVNVYRSPATPPNVDNALPSNLDTSKGSFRPIEYQRILDVCPALANAAHSIDINLYSRRHILQLQKQLDKGVIRNIAVLRIPRNVNIY
ncbi:hypothetical protein EV421DRAFT_110255 [Armillaria borealis]|uniref:Uncharacterized protein n=1 Tax=Armillaria borealis TaxID=47425 RepID=A0AA39MVX9_9AGAR|nr:hypothetical protein EV421DRAFT_110255 [Armillaria borealis]